MIPKRAGVALWTYLVLALAFILAPVGSLVLMSFHEGKVPSFPIERFSWKWFGEACGNSDLRQAALTSLFIAVVAASFSVALGFISAHWLSRRCPRGQISYICAISLPCLVPLLLSGMALLLYYQQIRLAGTKWSIIAAHVCYCSPFAMAIIRTSYQNLNVELELAAANLGASPARVILDVAIPQLWPSLACAFAICFLVSWDEFVLAWFVGGFTKTLPTVIYGILGSSYTPALNAVGTLSMLITIALLSAALLFQQKAAEGNG